MTYTDTQLKQALAKMLPEQIECIEQMPMCGKELAGSELINGAWRYHSGQYTLYWKHVTTDTTNEVLDTELLHLCWLVEKEWRSGDRTENELIEHVNILDEACRCHHNQVGDFGFATWQQRTTALCKVKGVEIL